MIVFKGVLNIRPKNLWKKYSAGISYMQKFHFLESIVLEEAADAGNSNSFLEPAKSQFVPKLAEKLFVFYVTVKHLPNFIGRIAVAECDILRFHTFISFLSPPNPPPTRMFCLFSSFRETNATKK